MPAPPRAKDAPLQEVLQIVEGLGQFRPVGECTLVEAADLINLAIEHCRSRRVGKLLVDAKGLSGVAIPSLVDRFLMVEQWAHQAKGMVVVVLVIHAEYIHPQKFGVRVAADFGLMADVFSSEPEALEWLANTPTGI
jgi:hypothetical protein